jgi:hypothetical protein
MKQEILLKAYVVHQSEEAFRELVAASLDEVYSTAFRIVRGASDLAEETSLRVFLELARKAPKLGEDVVLALWLREHTCKMAVIVLQEDGRSVDGPTLKSERQAASVPKTISPAPPGLAFRVCQGVLLNAARNKRSRFRFFSWPPWLRGIPPQYVKCVCGGASCLLVIILLWSGPFHGRSHQIIQVESVQLTPASFAQLGRPGDEDTPATTNSVVETKTETKSNSKQP